MPMKFRVKTTQAAKAVRDNLKLTTFGLYRPQTNKILEERNLQEIFDAVAEDPSCPLKTMARTHDIPFEILQTGISYLIASMPCKVEDLFGEPASKARILIDENLQPQMNIKLWSVLGQAMHTKHLSISSFKDDKLWNWAARGNIDVIVTRDTATGKEDKDLGMIALRHAFDEVRKNGANDNKRDAPIVLGFKAKDDQQVRRLMAKYKYDIQDALDRHASPLVIVDQTGVHNGPTYRAIARNDWDEVKRLAVQPH